MSDYKKYKKPVFVLIKTIDELPKKRDHYPVILRNDNSWTIKRFMYFDPTDQQSIKKFKEEVREWKKLIKT